MKNSTHYRAVELATGAFAIEHRLDDDEWFLLGDRYATADEAVSIAEKCEVSLREHREARVVRVL